MSDYEKDLKKTREDSKPKIKNVEGRQLVIKGVIEKITSINSKYGESHRIEMNGNSFYFNSKVPGAVDKMFEIGKLAAFTVRESINRHNPDKPFLVIETIFYTF